MGEVNYYLNPASEKTGKAHIYLRYRYNGKQLKYSFGQSIDPKFWNENKQRVKNSKVTTEDGKHYLNDLLDNLAKECTRAYNEALKNGIPAPETLREKLNAFINQNDGKSTEKKMTLLDLVHRFTTGEIKYNGRDKSPNTILTYKTTEMHLKGFMKAEKEYSKGLAFEDINLDFYYKYVTYLKSRKLGQNAISKNVQILKLFMNEAVDLGYTDNMKFKHKKFAVSRVETDAVYLTNDELMALYKFDFSGHPKLEAVRDLFIFGCFVGLRYSDYSTIKPEYIVKLQGEHFIKMITQKTAQLVIIPCNPVIMEIFEKYKSNPNRLPRAISSQKFNEYIKDACKVAGMTEKGRLATEPTLELWECISSHTARRSFATNLYLENFPPIDLMKVTGHTTEKAFMKYIRVTKLDTAMRMSKHIKNNWNEKLIKLTE